MRKHIKTMLPAVSSISISIISALIIGSFLHDLQLFIGYFLLCTGLALLPIFVAFMVADRILDTMEKPDQARFNNSLINRTGFEVSQEGEVVYRHYNRLS